MTSASLESFLNKASHHLPYKRLVEVLIKLFQDGDLLAHRRDQASFVPTQSELEDGLSGLNNIYYGLTSQGGFKWEQVSNPEWHRYYSFWSETDHGIVDSSTTWDAEIISMSHQLIREYLDIGMKGMRAEILTLDQEVVVRPWNATYWKPLSFGYCIKFSYRQAPLRVLPEEFEQWNIMNTEYLEWLGRISRWYSNPFEP